MKYNIFHFNILNIFYIVLIITTILIIFYIINNAIKKQNIENFCKIPNINNQGGINDKRVELTYKPQSNIKTSSCEEYWKSDPREYNSSLLDDDVEPIELQNNQLSLPKEKQFGDKAYIAGLIDYKELAKVVEDKHDSNFDNTLEELLINPQTQEKLNFHYDLQYIYITLNKDTWKNRWKFYNPSEKKIYTYDEIKSPIENINILNLEFMKRINIKQKDLLSNKQLITFGLVDFQLFKYKILKIKYLNSDPTKPVYIMQVTLFREQDLYITTLSYYGYIENNNPIIVNAKFIGLNSTDAALLPNFYDKNLITDEIINKKFSNSPILDKDPDSIVQTTKDQAEALKLKNQYACFNIYYQNTGKDEYLLPYYSRESCEASYDPYGKSKLIGIYDRPCKEDKECPFFNINKNYKNNFGKCQSDGHCELPINMKPLGYRYFVANNDQAKPLCYNCNSTKFNISSTLDSCCEEQYDKTKYPFLESPDYAFKDDFLPRKNYFNSKNCYIKPGSLDVKCK